MLAQKFKRYEIQEELGVGGMATVYRAYDPSFERDVALKILKRELLEDPQLRERFERETKIVAKLEHPAIVPVYDVDFDNSQLFYVMRYMPGGSLTERIQEGNLSLEQIAYILLRLADALDYAHRKGVVHRDLKPGNILFDENDNASLSDFGIAKFTQASTRITHSGIIGTPRYMSPEQARGDETDGRTDQYSLGVILFEMLSGQTPFEATTPLAMAFKHATEPAPNILDVNPNLPPAISDIFKKTLEKNPWDRYDTTAEFANAFLEALPADTAPNAKFITPIPPRIHPKHESTELSPTPAATPRPKTRNWMIAGFIALALLGFSLWGYFGLSQANASSSTPTTATTAFILPSPTTSPPTATATISPTKEATLEPTALPVDPGIGGALRIALTTNREVYLMDMDGTNITQLTNTNIPKFDLQWLPGAKELLYIEGKCVYTVNVEELQPVPEKIGCFSGEYFEGFRVSPDGEHAAISIDRRLIVLPFDREFLSTAKTAFELQNWEETCINYADVAVKGAQWSADGGSLAVKYQSIVNQRVGDTIRVMDVDLVRCQSVDPLIIDEFPGKHFSPESYQKTPALPYFHWDGIQRFLLNTFIRNNGYGELYQYDMSTTEDTRLDPVGDCCYRNGTFSPDGTYILFLFQDITQGAKSETFLYYTPLDGSETKRPIKLPLGFFSNTREEILFALQDSTP
jgi:serine/threonine protein kinase